MTFTFIDIILINRENVLKANKIEFHSTHPHTHTPTPLTFTDDTGVLVVSTVAYSIANVSAQRQGGFVSKATHLIQHNSLVVSTISSSGSQ